MTKTVLMQSAIELARNIMRLSAAARSRILR